MSEPCPKCLNPRPQIGDACPQCGLIFARFDPEILEEGVPDSLKREWLAVQGNWDEREKHALFVQHAVDCGQLGYAAACYRRRGDDPVAMVQLEQISKQLEQQLLLASGTTTGVKKTGRWMQFLLFLLAGAVLLLFLLIWRQR